MDNGSALHFGDKPLQVGAGDLIKPLHLFGNVRAVINTFKPLVAADTGDDELPVWRQRVIGLPGKPVDRLNQQKHVCRIQETPVATLNSPIPNVPRTHYCAVAADPAKLIGARAAKPVHRQQGGICVTAFKLGFEPGYLVGVEPAIGRNHLTQSKCQKNGGDDGKDDFRQCFAHNVTNELASQAIICLSSMQFKYESPNILWPMADFDVARMEP